MSKNYFGTDGVRGRVGEPPITPELVLKLGYAAGRVLASESAGKPGETPAVAYLTRALRLSAGVVISASHNPFEDNGIKFFSASGTKLPDAVEQAIERSM